MNNAELANVRDIIKFENKNYEEFLKEGISWTLVSNPPYGLRLKNDNLDELYKNISTIFNNNKDLKWWIITNYQFWDLLKNNYKKRKLYNWQELCYLYLKGSTY
jgi:putative N6-adenine-specific DNA methylase